MYQVSQICFSSWRRNNDIGLKTREFDIKTKGIRRIKQGSDINQSEIGRTKVTDIDYNTVAPFYL